MERLTKIEDFLLDCASETKISDNGSSVGFKKNVSYFYVPMNDMILF